MPSFAMRVAFFGGSFDPPHRGHIAIARAAADHFCLHRVLFAPAGCQPLKRKRPGASYDQRLRMVELACADQADPRLVSSNVDAPRPGDTPNYTVDTLQDLARERPGEPLFSLAGADSFHDLGRWREPQHLLALAEWIVVSRPGYALLDPAGLTLSEAQRERIHLLPSVHVDAAASRLRERLRQGDPCLDLLSPSVAAYIQQQGLYTEAPTH